VKLDSINPISVTLTLTATDCLLLHDALDSLLAHDHDEDRTTIAAVRSAFLGFAVLAAFDTIKDNQVPEAGMIADTRRVWGMAKEHKHASVE
jgi:hypothetical protein